MKACFQAVLLFLFSTLIAFQVNAGEYEFGSFDTSVCSSLIVAESEDSYDDGSGCKIVFKKTFATRPLVFLMPTIPSVNPDIDAPQSLALLNVTKSSFSVAQVVAPLAKKNSNLQKNKMATISYLAIEAGITEFDDGHKVFAGSISTKRFVSDGNQSNPAYEYINLTTKAPFITQSPIVLSEVQGRKNKRWLTTAITNLSPQGFNIGLELTRVNKKEPDIDSKERVGFLISQPHAGETLGYDYEFSFGDIISNSGKDYPLQHVCNSEVGFSHKNYSTVPNVIAGKLTRKGGQGGWLRRCVLTNKGVSFVIDEDIPENTAISSRRHTDEKVGFLAFADKPMLPPVTDDECKYFLGPAQTWENNEINYTQLQVGALSRLINTVEKDNKRYVGFEQLYIRDGSLQGCDDKRCLEDTSLIVKAKDRPILAEFKESQTNNTFDATNPNEPILEYDDYSSISIRGGNITLDKDVMIIKFLSLDANSTLTLKSGSYWVDSLSVSGSNIIVPENNKVYLYVKGFSFHHTSGSSGSLINSNG
ncbi:MSHA biogenesis protein MshQ, partial [Photobacterium sp. CAIM 1938]|nr:MSHA biogenesis protein MshQ [Photobacterium lucens]